MKNVREPQVAGMFYPSNPKELENQINGFINGIKVESEVHNVKGIVAPHAGYMYSGKTAAYAFKTIKNKNYKNVIVISPSHREYFRGISIFSGDAYSTPLGDIVVNKELRTRLVGYSDIIFEGLEGHREEHALEVQLPFLQIVLEDFNLIPIVIGDQNKEFVYGLANALADVIEDDTLIVASSDLSHFYTRGHAQKLDHRIAEHINNYNFEELQNDLEMKRCEACGGGGIVALMKALKMKNVLNSRVVAQSDSGDITGDENEVVGYLSAILYN